MTADPTRARWLTFELLLRLMLPLLVIVAAAAAFGSYTAHRLAARIYDGWLLDAARSVASQVRFEHGVALLDLPPVAEAILLFDDRDRTDFSVYQGSRRVAGRPGVPLAGSNESQVGDGTVYDASLDGAPVRVARVTIPHDGGDAVTVRVAETGMKRQRSGQELVTVLWPMLALVAAAVLSILLAVRRTFQPLRRIVSHWNERSHVSLQAIDDAGVPRELLPFTAALNDLLARMRGLLARERQFAATAAHQLRTPLAGLQLGLARVARAADLDDARRIVGELSHLTERTGRIVQQLLALGSIDRENRADMAFVACDLVTVAEDIGAVYADKALASNIDLELTAPVRPVTVMIVPELIAEALANLLDNALRHTPAAGRIVVEVVARPATIRVSDSGPGVSEDEREAVFGRFVRGRTATGDGSGLGLAIVSEIAVLHGAAVSLTESPWGGAAVSLAFQDPAATPTPAARSRTAPVR